VFELIAHISATALSEEGIFRVPGNLEALNQYKKRIDSGLASGIVNKVCVGVLLFLLGVSDQRTNKQTKKKKNGNRTWVPTMQQDC
jgi:hypothetical protein